MKLFKTRKRASSRMVGSGVGVKRSVVTVFMIFLVGIYGFTFDLHSKRGI